MDLATALKKLEMQCYTGPEDLKRAFHALAHRYHPDKNPHGDATERFRDLVAAYQYCSEHLSELAAHFGVTVSQSPEDEVSVRLVIENLDDIFEDIFGFTRSGRVLGYQEPAPLYLTVREFALGGTKNVKLPAYRRCDRCRGIGAAGGALSRLCRHCFGKGYTVRRGGDASERRACPRCDGRGREIERRCPDCDGYGRLPLKRAQRLDLPVGLKPGGLYTLSAVDRKTGDATEVFVEARSLADRIFQIENYDLLCEYHMDFSRKNTNVLLNFETPFGKKTVEIPAAARPGDVVIIPHAGLYKDSARSEQGVLKVRLKQKKPSFFSRIFGG